MWHPGGLGKHSLDERQKEGLRNSEGETEREEERESRMVTVVEDDKEGRQGLKQETGG